MRVSNLLLPSVAVLALAGAPAASAAGGGAGVTTSAKTTSQPATSANSGGAGVSPRVVPPSQPSVPGFVAKIIHGVAYAPAEAPRAVQLAIWAGNRIRHKPYIYGGGHGSFNDVGYDCSGSVSYVLHAAGLLQTPFDSSEFMSWGRRGVGNWITVYTNPGHAFVEIAGIRLDTSSEGDPNYTGGSGPRWRWLLRDTGGFDARHPARY